MKTIRKGLSLLFKTILLALLIAALTPIAPTPPPMGTLPPPATGWIASNYTYSASIPHAVTGIMRGTSTDTYAYDLNGNMTCRVEDNPSTPAFDQISYKQEYNTENRISAIHKMSGDCASNAVQSWNFAYDGDGVRTMTSTNLYDGITPLPATVTSYYFGGAYEMTGTSVKKYYSFAGQTIAMRDSAGINYFLTDHLGSIIAVTDSAGTLINQQRYLPFGGERTNIGNITQTDFGYTGQRDLDPGMGGLMDYRARMYSPTLGRFIQPDSIVPGAANPQAWNRYSYTLNNPIRYNDPTGHWCVGPVGIVCVTAVVIAVSFVIYTQIDNTQPPVAPGQPTEPSGIADWLRYKTPTPTPSPTPTPTGTPASTCKVLAENNCNTRTPSPTNTPGYGQPGGMIGPPEQPTFTNTPSYGQPGGKISPPEQPTSTNTPGDRQPGDKIRILLPRRPTMVRIE